MITRPPDFGRAANSPKQPTMKIKNLFRSALLLGAMLTLALPAAGQGYNAYAVQTLLTGGTNIVTAASSNVVSGSIITLTRQREVAIQASFAAVGTNDSTITFWLQPSVDGSTFDTSKNLTHNFTVAANGTSTVNITTNITVGAVGYLRLAINNPNATMALTNVSVKASIKR